MNDGLLRTAWLTGLGATVAGPPLLWLATAPPEPMWSRLAVVSGFFALTVLVCAAVLPSRLRSLNRAFGIESVMEVHRFLGVSAAVLVLVHLACVLANDPRSINLLKVLSAPPRAQAATAATRRAGAAGRRRRAEGPAAAVLRVVALDACRARGGGAGVLRSAHACG